MNDTITYGEIAPRVGIQAVARLLKVGQPLLVTQRFAQIDDAKRNTGDTIKWRRYHSFTVSTAPLAEGIPPASQPLEKTDYTAILKQYGAVAELTDKVRDLHEDSILSVLVTRSGEQMAQTIESVTIDVLKSGTNVYYANGAASRAALASAPRRGDFLRIGRQFDRDDGKEISRMISPTAKIGTRGTLPAFFAMCHTDLYADIKHITGYIAVTEYGDPNSRIPGERGQVDRFRFVMTRMFTPWFAGATGTPGQTTFLTDGAPGTGSADVYPIICVARDAYGTVRLQGMKSVGIKVVQPKPSHSQPLGQKGYVGWITWYASAILSEQWIARLECLATANPT